MKNSSTVNEFIEQRRRAAIRVAPDSSKGILERAYYGSHSKAHALKAKCLECANFQRPEVTACTVYSCPLWRYRPYQQKAAKQNEE